MQSPKLKSAPRGRRRKLALYTKAPFKLTNEHYKAIIVSLEELRFVSVTYKLTLDRTEIQRLEFGGKETDLEADRTDDGNIFESEDPIDAPVTDGMLWVVVRAGKRKLATGGGWSLEVFADGVKLSDFPIEEEIQSSNNRADHDDLHVI